MTPEISAPPVETFYCVKCGKQQEAILCGFLCLDCKTYLNSVSKINGYSVGKTLRDKELTHTNEETLKIAVWDAWDMTRIFTACPEENLGYYLKYFESTLGFISDITRTREIAKISKANNDPESVRKFKEALLKKREEKGKGKKKKEPKHDTNGVLNEPAVKVNKNAKYKTDDPIEKMIVDALWTVKDQASSWRTGVIEMLIKSQPKHDVREIARKMGLEV